MEVFNEVVIEGVTLLYEQDLTRETFLGRSISFIVELVIINEYFTEVF